MRIIHTSDLHLDSPLTGLSTDKVRERKDELYSTFLRMINEAKRASVTIFIISGDLFDTVKVSRRAAERVANAIEDAHEIDFLYLPGNHERGGFLEKLTHIPKNLSVFGEDWTYFNFGDVTVAGRSEVSKDMFNTLTLDGSRKNILALHGTVREYSGSQGGISLVDARGHGIDYMALGHYHSHSEYRIDSRGVAVYCGTPEGRGFDEAGECGFMLLDTDGEGIGYRFCPFARRTVRIVEADTTGILRSYDIEGRVEAALSGIPSDDLVRVVLVGERDMELSVDINAIVSRFGCRFYHFEAKDATRLAIDPDVFAYDKSLKGEFIRLVSARSDLSEEMKAKIIRCGISALLGEDGEV